MAPEHRQKSITSATVTTTTTTSGVFRRPTCNTNNRSKKMPCQLPTRRKPPSARETKSWLLSWRKQTFDSRQKQRKLQSQRPKQRRYGDSNTIHQQAWQVDRPSHVSENRTRPACASGPIERWVISPILPYLGDGGAPTLSQSSQPTQRSQQSQQDDGSKNLGLGVCDY